MNNYLNEVQKHLSGIPQKEAIELLEYYEEYFLDANLTLEQIIEKYGTPKKFAQALKMTYFLEHDDENSTAVQPQNTKHRLQLVWLIVLGLFASPLLLPVALSLFLVLFACCVVLFALLFSCYITVIALIFSGFFTLISAFGILAQSLVTFIFFTGIAFVAIGLGFIFTPLTLEFTHVLFNLFMKFIKWIGYKLTKKSNIKVRGVI